VGKQRRQSKLLVRTVDAAVCVPMVDMSSDVSNMGILFICLVDLLFSMCRGLSLVGVIDYRYGLGQVFQQGLAGFGLSQLCRCLVYSDENKRRFGNG